MKLRIAPRSKAQLFHPNFKELEIIRLAKIFEVKSQFSAQMLFIMLLIETMFFIIGNVIKTQLFHINFTKTQLFHPNFQELEIIRLPKFF